MAIDFELIEYGFGTVGVRTQNAVVKIHRNSTKTSSVYTIKAESLINIGDKTASLSSDQPVYLEKNTFLYFDTKPLILTESKVIDVTPTTVAINSVGITIQANETASTYGLITLPTNEIENNEVVETVDAKIHAYGEQGAQERVGRTFNPTIGLIIKPGDIGYFEHVLPAAINKAGYDGSVTAFIAIPVNDIDFEYTFGIALVTIDEDSNTTNEIRKPKITLSFQSPWLKTSLIYAE